MEDMLSFENDDAVIDPSALADTTAESASDCDSSSCSSRCRHSDDAARHTDKTHGHVIAWMSTAHGGGTALLQASGRRGLRKAPRCESTTRRARRRA